MAKKERELNALQLANSVDLNFEELRRERELALQEAALRPILTGRRAGHTHVTPSELYPHVYDAMLDVLLSSAVLAGAKVGVGRGGGEWWIRTSHCCSLCVCAGVCVCVSLSPTIVLSFFNSANAHSSNLVTSHLSPVSVLYKQRNVSFPLFVEMCEGLPAPSPHTL